MSYIRAKDTKPEIKLRKELFRMGYRYRLNVKGLDGRPDIVLAKFRTCIFVNGCFWHGHKGCTKFVLPKTNAEFWLAKIEANKERDLRDYAFLESKGWRVIVVWECELGKSNFPNTVFEIQRQLDANRESWLEEIADRKLRRDEWREEMMRRKERERGAKKETYTYVTWKSKMTLSLKWSLKLKEKFDICIKRVAMHLNCSGQVDAQLDKCICQ